MQHIIRLFPCVFLKLAMDTNLKSLLHLTKVKKIQKIALDRVRILFNLARNNSINHIERSNRYVELANKIAMRARVRIPREFKRRYCKNCFTYLISGKNCRIRTRNKKLVIACFKCRKITRILLTRK